MPKVNIYEYDGTSDSEVVVDNNVVAVFGKGTSGDGGIVLVTKESELPTDTAQPSIGHKIAKKLVNSGFKVLYAYWTENSNDDATSIKAGLDALADRSKYGGLRFIVLGDWQNTSITFQTGTTGKAIDYAIYTAAKRGDAIALVDGTDNNATPGGTKDDSTSAVDTYINSLCGVAGFNKVTRTLLSDRGTTIVREEWVSKYASGFTADCTIDGVTYPGYLDYLLAFKQHTATYPDWFAMSGSVRGQVSGLTAIGGDYGDADIDVLEARSVPSTGTAHRATNVIANIYPYGKIIWGNRTLFPVLPEETAEGVTVEGKVELCASSFLNIRNLCIDIKKKYYEAARKYAFDPNSDTLWINFKSEIIPLLEKMKSNQGINGYQIKKIATKAKATLAAKIIIVPIEAVEDFDLILSLEDSIVAE